MAGKFKDLTGKTFNYLTAIRRTGYYVDPKFHKKSAKWLWKCECGKEVERLSKQVTCTKPKSTSCGCKSEFKKNFGSQSTAYQIFTGHYSDGNVTFEEFLYLAQQECYWCGQFNQNIRKHACKPNVFYTYHGLDRIDNTKGHDSDNIVPACWRCNNLRGKRSVPEFLEVIQDIYLNRINHELSNT